MPDEASSLPTVETLQHMTREEQGDLFLSPLHVLGQHFNYDWHAQRALAKIEALGLNPPPTPPGYGSSQFVTALHNEVVEDAYLRYVVYWAIRMFLAVRNFREWTALVCHLVASKTGQSPAELMQLTWERRQTEVAAETAMLAQAKEEPAPPPVPQAPPDPLAEMAAAALQQAPPRATTQPETDHAVTQSEDAGGDPAQPLPGGAADGAGGE